ncbi:MAG: hypothetical protein WCQ21_31880, partial [Verrucomicrobiota bacterium]
MDQSLLTSAATESLATGTWQWGLELQSYGFAGQERAVAEPPRVNTSGPRVTYDWDATVQEWFVNDRRGLEHGFTVRERPLLRSAGFPTCCIADFLIGRPFDVARSAGFPTCCIADFLIGRAFDVARSAGWETCETADLKVCATADERAGALQDAAAPSLNSSASASRSGATAPKRSEGGQPSTLNFLLAVRGGLRPEVQAD